MSGYSIHYLEQLTGIKAHTMRVWEQRYKLITPTRSQTNIRSYSDSDLKKLLNISTLLNAGLRIGDISRLTNDDLYKKVSLLQKRKTEVPVLYAAAINAFIAAAMTYDESAFTKQYKQCITRHGMEYTYEHILYPMLVRIGTLWKVNKLNPAQEHFLTNLIRQKMFAGINELKIPASTNTWVLFLPEHEEHEIGLLYANFMFRFYGVKTIYLGQRVPLDTLSEVVESVKPAGLFYFQVSQIKPHYTATIINALDKRFKNLPTVICTGQEAVKGLKLPNNIEHISNPSSFLNWLKQKAHHA